MTFIKGGICTKDRKREPREEDGYMLTTLGHDVHGQLDDLVFPTVVPLDTTRPQEGATNGEWGLIDNVGLMT